MAAHDSSGRKRPLLARVLALCRCRQTPRVSRAPHGTALEASLRLRTPRSSRDPAAVPLANARRAHSQSGVPCGAAIAGLYLHLEV